MSSTRVKLASFTLVELLIVIAILAVLAAAVVIVLNPAELLAQARDTQRISDVNMVKKAVDLFIVDNSTSSLGTSQKVYVSIPDTSITCANIAGLPLLPAGWSYNCVTSANLRNINGTGWLPIDLTQVKGGSPIPYLPIDPQNDQSLTRYYQYIPGTNTFELTTLMESARQAKAAGSDGGADPGRLEVGSDVSLWKTASNLKGNWEFNGSGDVSDGQVIGFEDSSGSNNNGTAHNVNGSGMSFVSGKSGNAIQCDGVDDWIGIPINVSGNNASIIFWIKNPGISGYLLRSTANVRTYFQETSSTRISFTKGSPYVGIGSTPILSSNIWHQVAMTWRNDGGILKASIYYDGSVIASDVVFTDSSQGSYISVCSFSLVGDSVASGAVDRLMEYERTLSASEISAMYYGDK